ncbi:ATPase family associated with various cellular activities (AAA) domain-containing protein [Ditylenchus destructor]|uniref:Vesicle-fusing ATPase n=1 Tax=Ditylenchus destructor TaxID=166010 RepID=A0AAD4N9L3_9BILA|nr:ATPase family associated with various cellular activities (AAA) domain-containing protein [Ditylenchus destructor]
MAQLRLSVNKMPTEDLSYSNRAVVNANDLDAKQIKHIQVITGPAHRYLFSIANHPEVRRGEIAFSMIHRKWTSLSLQSEVHVQPFSFSASDRVITSIQLLTDFQNTKKAAGAEPLDSDAMAREFSMQFSNMVFTKGEELLFRYCQKDKQYVLKLMVKHLEGARVNSDTVEIEHGSLIPNAAIVFDKAEGSMVNLVGRSKGKSAHRSLINPEWNFQKMGIGGLDKEFSAIFRRAFASRVFPPEFVEQLAMKHVRGILLYGPPGTGKTLIARQIGKMLNAREPKIVNGPEILNKYVGESEANMRKLFAEAEEEWKRCASNSGLHIIIFDEIDAICKQRGSMAGSTGVHDTVVNQLLTKLDGVEQLNNILVIGMTNRRDMIDEALMRPGRMEVQLEISLPDEAGRVQILKIHTARMREYNKMDPNVDLVELGKKTKNFSGAEIEGLVRAAQSSAMNRLVKAGGEVKVDEDAVEKLMVNRDDFEYALENDVKAAFGHRGDLIIKETMSPDTKGFTRVLLAGPRNSGKTSLAAKIAKNSDFPFIKVCTPDDMVGYSETAKCMQLRKVFDDAYRSPLSCIIIDNIERLLDYSPVGMRYSNLVLQALLVLLGKRPPANRRLLVLATTSNEDFLRQVDLVNSFSSVITVPRLRTVAHIITVLEDNGAFSDAEIARIRDTLNKSTFKFSIGIKRLLELIDFARQSEGEYRVKLFLNSFESEALGLD